MKSENDSLKSNNLFSKIKLWVYNLFHNLPKNKIVVEDKKTTNIISKNNDKQKNYFEECKEKNRRRQYLLILQNKYKSKEILERDMSEEDRIDLENLYVEQNTELKRKIRSLEYKAK